MALESCWGPWFPFGWKTGNRQARDSTFDRRLGALCKKALCNANAEFVFSTPTCFGCLIARFQTCARSSPLAPLFFDGALLFKLRVGDGASAKDLQGFPRHGVSRSESFIQFDAGLAVGFFCTLEAPVAPSQTKKGRTIRVGSSCFPSGVLERPKSRSEGAGHAKKCRLTFVKSLGPE